MEEPNPWEDAQDSAKNSRKNIFDDDVSFDMAKKMILYEPSFEESAGDDGIDFNYEGAPSKPKPSSPGPDIDNLGTPSFGAPRYQNDPSPFIPKNVSMNHSRSLSLGDGKKMTPAGLEDHLNRGVSNPSIEDVVEYNRKKPPPEDTDRLQAEIQFLRRTNLLSKHDRWSKLPVSETVKRMLRGENYTLELYRSLEDKLLLVDEAIKVHDGNCIIATILFFKRTVKASIFNFELSRRPVAFNQYLSYLRSNVDYRELSHILEMMGRTEEAAMLQYKVASSSTLGASKVGAIRSVHRNHFNMDQQLASEAALVLEHVDLLERQSPIEDADAKEEAGGRNQLFRDMPRKNSLYGMSLITTLYYCCLYHFNLSENSLASPVALKKKYQLCDKQFLYCAIGAQAKLNRWHTIEELLTTKGWFGATKMKAAIGFDKVVEILHKNNAPMGLLHKYLQYIDDLDLQLELAKKLKCHKAVIDVFVKSRERGQLEDYASRLKPKTEEYFYSADALNNSSIKWK